jgi:hypothetical protein
MQRPQYLKYVRKDIVLVEKTGRFSGEGIWLERPVFFLKCF